MNLYLSFGRYPIYRLRGGVVSEYKWISGIPMFGSLLIVGALLLLHMHNWLWWFGAICAILDTAGLHWFLGTMLYTSRAGWARDRE